jgi:ParB family chromosome partitioning protein
MGASLQQLKDSAREAETLKASVAQGDRVVDIDPGLIDDAPVADRFRQDKDPALAELAESIRATGQQIPVLVRPHPVRPDRWQAAYGHRRIRACRQAGLPVKAIVRQLSDAELAVAQGKENLERRDLSFIEKAFFAAGLEAAGFSRAVISDALGSDRADTSRYIAMARVVPEDLARLIGPAPKTGRPRWQELADAIGAQAARGVVASALVSHLPLLAGFERADSDQRFRMVLDRVKTKVPAASGEQALVSDESGSVIVARKGRGATQTFAVNDGLSPGFADHLADAIPVLYARWRAKQSTPKE